jgi:hypothetical protein
MRASFPVVAFVLLWTSLAFAQSDDDALIHHGVELRKQGQNAEALAEFRRADEKHPSARAKAQIALAEQALGHWADAERGLVSVLADEQDPWIAHNRGPLEAALATIRDHLGTLEIESNVAGATIVVNGAVVGTSPLPGAVRLVAGTAHIEVEARGYGTMKREIEVPPHGAVKAAIVVMPVAEPVSSAPQASGAIARPGAPVPSQSDNKKPVARGHSVATQSSSAGVIALVAAAPLLATGIIAHVVRENSVATYNDDARCFLAGKTRDQRCGSYHDTANTAGVVAIVGYGAGAAALITGVTLLLTGTRSARADDDLHVTARLDAHSAYFACDVGF